MSKRSPITNIIKKEQLREIQSETLALLSDSLVPSFGPMGSNTTISNSSRLTQYTKDGKTILNSIQIAGDIEGTVKQDVYEITRSVVKNVGDGTTSAIILSHLIFEYLKQFTTNLTPFELMREFQETVDAIITKIRSRSKELDLEGVYKIALVSTNGNKKIAESIKNIYQKFGMGVFIDVAVSMGSKTFTKEYDGMSLDNGYMDVAFVNSPKNLCIIQHPQIYAFIDPVNTLEQAKFLDKILYDNIITPIMNKDLKSIKPTLIMVPSISRDLSMYIDSLITQFGSVSIDQRLPFCIITDVVSHDRYMDLVKLLGCKGIQKSIDPKIYNELVEKGLAPTLDNVSTFFGTCEQVVIDSEKAKFINPKLMRDSDGNYTEVFNNHINYLETELKKQQHDGANAVVIGELKRRIQSLKSNLVEFYIGGISASDRDCIRDLVEDAVLNIRSAAKYGYGLASNIEGLLASSEVNTDLGRLIYFAYKDLIKILYNNSNVTENHDEIINTIKRDRNVVYDVYNKKFSSDIISSIESDCAVLEAISKIITLLFTTNQYLCENTATANMYK